MIFLRTLFANDDFDWRFGTVVMTERAGGALRGSLPSSRFFNFESCETRL